MKSIKNVLPPLLVTLWFGCDDLEFPDPNATSDSCASNTDVCCNYDEDTNCTDILTVLLSLVGFVTFILIVVFSPGLKIGVSRSS
jgi:hypothetical protein